VVGDAVVAAVRDQGAAPVGYLLRYPRAPQRGQVVGRAGLVVGHPQQTPVEIGDDLSGAAMAVPVPRVLGALHGPAATGPGDGHEGAIGQRLMIDLLQGRGQLALVADHAAVGPGDALGGEQAGALVHRPIHRVLREPDHRAEPPVAHVPAQVHQTHEQPGSEWQLIGAARPDSPLPRPGGQPLGPLRLPYRPQLRHQPSELGSRHTRQPPQLRLGQPRRAIPTNHPHTPPPTMPCAGSV
jgi:hypothetical protein